MSTLTTTFHWASDKTSPRPSRLKKFYAALVQEIRIRRAVRQLAALDDGTLYDIGLSRSSIEDAARHGRR